MKLRGLRSFFHLELGNKQYLMEQIYVIGSGLSNHDRSLMEKLEFSEKSPRR